MQVKRRKIQCLEEKDIIRADFTLFSKKKIKVNKRKKELKVGRDSNDKFKNVVGSVKIKKKKQKEFRREIWRSVKNTIS